jgi:hypothetical protein
VGHCQAHLGLNKATWDNLVATRYRERLGDAIASIHQIVERRSSRRLSFRHTGFSKTQWHKKEPEPLDPG